MKLGGSRQSCCCTDCPGGRHHGTHSGYAHRKRQKLFTVKVHFASQVAERRLSHERQVAAVAGAPGRRPSRVGWKQHQLMPGSGRAVVAAWRGTESQLVSAWSVHSHGGPAGPASWPPSQFPKMTSTVLTLRGPSPSARRRKGCKAGAGRHQRGGVALQAE